MVIKLIYPNAIRGYEALGHVWFDGQRLLGQWMLWVSRAWGIGARGIGARGCYEPR